jgi:hypothetical protein
MAQQSHICNVAQFIIRDVDVVIAPPFVALQDTILNTQYSNVHVSNQQSPYVLLAHRFLL